MVHQDLLTLPTQGHGHMQRIDGEVAGVVRSSGIRHGVAHVFQVGSTGAIGTIEFEPGLEGDLPEALDRVLPPSRRYGHERAWHDGNGHSHLQATLLGPSLTVPVRDGELVLGTWQQVVFCDFDNRPRRRRIVAQVMGE